MKRINIYIVGLVLVLISCKEHYNPTATSVNSNILVVDGFINTGADSTFISLSRSVILANKTVANPEIGATLSIETSANESINLVEKSKGRYVAPPLNFGSNKKYRLKIRTKNGANYLSDFVTAVASPQIDSLNYEVKPEGVQVYVSASDPTNNTHYYRWDYAETWIFYAQYSSMAIWRGGPRAVDRNFDEGIFKCWGNANSSTIVLGSSLKLSKDVISMAPLATILSTSEKITEKYSVLVKQYGLTKEAYEFWQNLKKNTESLGSIFDVLPSQLTGNIHNVSNTADPIIGYISAGTTQTKRLFISKDKLPNWRPTYPYDCSQPDTVKFIDQVSRFGSSNSNLVPLEIALNEKGNPVGHLAAIRQCADCTIRGTVKRPIFWQ